MAVDFRDDRHDVGPGACCSACGEHTYSWAEVRPHTGKPAVLVCTLCIDAMRSGLDEYMTRADTERDEAADGSCGDWCGSSCALPLGHDGLCTWEFFEKHEAILGLASFFQHVGNFTF